VRVDRARAGTPSPASKAADNDRTMERPWGRMTSAFELMRGTDSRLPAVQVDEPF